MVELDASKLPSDTLRELEDFLGKKLSVKVEGSTGKITIENVSNTRLRKVVRWFLRRKNLSGEYRVLSSGKSLVIRKMKKD